MKHTEIPHKLDDLRNNHSLEHGDKLIYASIRRYMNSETRICFPAIGTIASKLKCGINKVQSAIKRLVAVGLMVKSADGRKNCYLFPKSEFDKQFEMFTDEFLDMDLPLNVKEYYMDIQQYLYGKETGIGKCSLSNAELARRTGGTAISVKKYNTILIEKKLLEEEVTEKLDCAGFPVIQKSFDLQGLNQAALGIKKVTEAVVKHEQDIEEIKKELNEMREDSKRKDAKIEQLEKALARANEFVGLKNNEVIENGFKM